MGFLSFFLKGELKGNCREMIGLVSHWFEKRKQMRLSRWFPFKAVFSSNSVPQKGFTMVFLRDYFLEKYTFPLIKKLDFP